MSSPRYPEREDYIQQGRKDVAFRTYAVYMIILAIVSGIILRYYGLNDVPYKPSRWTNEEIQKIHTGAPKPLPGKFGKGRFLPGRYTDPVSSNLNYSYENSMSKVFLHKRWQFMTLDSERFAVSFAVADLGYTVNSFVYFVDKYSLNTTDVLFYDRSVLSPFHFNLDSYSETSVTGCTNFSKGSDFLLSICAGTKEGSTQRVWNVDLDVELYLSDMVVKNIKNDPFHSQSGICSNYRLQLQAVVSHPDQNASFAMIYPFESHLVPLAAFAADSLYRSLRVMCKSNCSSNSESIYTSILCDGGETVSSICNSILPSPRGENRVSVDVLRKRILVHSAFDIETASKDTTAFSQELLVKYVESVNDALSFFSQHTEDAESRTEIKYQGILNAHSAATILRNLLTPSSDLVDFIESDFFTNQDGIKQGYVHKALGMSATGVITFPSYFSQDGSVPEAVPFTAQSSIDWTYSEARRVTEWKWVSFMMRAQNFTNHSSTAFPRTQDDNLLSIHVNLSDTVYMSSDGVSLENFISLEWSSGVKENVFISSQVKWKIPSIERLLAHLPSYNEEVSKAAANKSATEDMRDLIFWRVESTLSSNAETSPNRTNHTSSFLLSLLLESHRCLQEGKAKHHVEIVDARTVIINSSSTPFPASFCHFIDATISLGFEVKGYRKEDVDFLVVETNFLQPFGVFNGVIATLQQCQNELIYTEIPVQNIYGVMENHYAKW